MAAKSGPRWPRLATSTAMGSTTSWLAPRTSTWPRKERAGQAFLIYGKEGGPGDIDRHESRRRSGICDFRRRGQRSHRPRRQRRRRHQWRRFRRSAGRCALFQRRLCDCMAAISPGRSITLAPRAMTSWWVPRQTEAFVGGLGNDCRDWRRRCRCVPGRRRR